MEDSATPSSSGGDEDEDDYDSTASSSLDGYDDANELPKLKKQKVSDTKNSSVSTTDVSSSPNTIRSNRKQVTALAFSTLPRMIPVGKKSDATTATTTTTDVTTVLFSGHADGSISRWDLSEIPPETAATATSTESNTTPMILDSNHSGGNSNDPFHCVWTIQGCPDLTQDSTYYNYPNLGIAGMAVRIGQRQHHRNENDSNKSTTKTTNDNDDESLLYSWSHQREDMRPSNGIPQKVMIWNTVCGKRLSALVIDIGRDVTGQFANPLVSAVVFATVRLGEVDKISTSAAPRSGMNAMVQQLIQEQQSQVNNNMSAQKQNQNIPSPQTVESIQQSKTPTKDKDDEVSKSDVTETKPEIKFRWVDMVVVGLQAICDDVYDWKGNYTNFSVQEAAKVGPGNILPFDEITRKRLETWREHSGMITALSVIPDHFVISISETPLPLSSPAGNGNAINGGKDDGDKPTTEINDKASIESSVEVSSPIRNTISEIVLWDIHHAGTVLHRLDLFDQKLRTYTIPSSLIRSTVCGIHSFNHADEKYILLTSNYGSLVTVLKVAPKNDTSNNTNAASISIVADVNLKDSSARESHGTNQHKFLGGHCAGYSDIVAVLTGLDDNRYSTFALSCSALIQNIISSKGEEGIPILKRNDLADGTVNCIDEMKESDCDKLIVPHVLSLQGGLSAVGNLNGTIQLTLVPSAASAKIPESDEVLVGGNEYNSCLHDCPVGRIIPHLSSAANNVQLQNKCVIQ